MGTQSALVDLPRERLINGGAAELSLQELLMIILQSGTQALPVSELAINVLHNYQELADLHTTTHRELMTINGIGPVKASQILASLEFGRRFAKVPFEIKKVIKTPEDAVGVVMSDMRYLKQEHFVCLYLNSKNHLLKRQTLYIGGVNETMISPREVYLKALQYDAVSFICFHNHPSGDVTPSLADEKATVRLHESGLLLGIRMIDHIIIGDGKFYSMKRAGVFV